jgi:hypothetical protein
MLARPKDPGVRRSRNSARRPPHDKVANNEFRGNGRARRAPGTGWLRSAASSPASGQLVALASLSARGWKQRSSLCAETGGVRG